MNDGITGHQGQARGDAVASAAAAAAESIRSSEVGSEDAASGKAKGSGASKPTGGGGGGHEQDARANESGNKHANGAAVVGADEAADGKEGPKSGRSLRNTATRLANIMSETAMVRRPRLFTPFKSSCGLIVG